MISAFISRIVILLFGTLYPAYASYKAVRTKDVKEYVKWMMYWIVFALFTCAETFTDLFLSFWFPFYYEIKIILVVYLLSPATKGSSILYRRFVHPVLTRREQEIDEYIARAKEQGYHTVISLGSKGVNYATTILMQTAIKGGGGLVSQIRKSYSLADIPGGGDQRSRGKTEERYEVDSACSEDSRRARHKPGGGSRRALSSGSPVDIYFTEVDTWENASSDNFIPSHIRSSEDLTSSYDTGDSSRVRQEVMERLTRTSSVSNPHRIRTRAAARAERTPSMTEEWDDASTGLVGDSQELSDNLNSQILKTLSDNSLLTTFMQALLAGLSEDQLIALFNNVTLPTISIKIENSAKAPSSNPILVKKCGLDCVESKIEAKQGEAFICNHGEISLCPESLGERSQHDEGKSVHTFQEYDTVKVESFSQSNTSEQGYEVSPTDTAAEQLPPSPSMVKAIRRTRKRQAPVPPIGGSLVDLHRLSQTSAVSLINVNSALYLDSSFRSSSPSPSDVSLNEKRRKEKTPDLSSSKLLQLPRLSFPFWQKAKAATSVVEFSSAKQLSNSVIDGSFISLHDDPHPDSTALLADPEVKEMSQSPSAKKRSTFVK